ncbi:MAG: imidazolonepropionase [Bacilli bacterium]
MKTLIVHNISQLVTVFGPNTLRQGLQMRDAGIIEDGFIVVSDGKFIAVGQGNDYLAFSGTKISGQGMTVIPGLIDSHTHLVHFGSRENDLKRQSQGETYLDILKSGGGIHETVQKTQNATFEQLFLKAKKSLDLMLSYGVTTVEAKSGYGLNLEAELKQLQVGKALNELHKQTIVNTFMGAHVIPQEYVGKEDNYIQELIKWMEVIQNEKLASFCDVFCEEGVFSLKQTRTILEKAKSLGFGLKMHADEMVSIGGAALASELKCHSVDHLLATSENDMEEIAKNKVVATILPLTSFYLNKPMANARMMIDKNCGIAIATDYNPGTSPSENLQLAMQMVFLRGKLTPEEIITAVTINAAVSLGLEQRKGSIVVGKDADFVVLNAPNLAYMLYHFGINHVQNVYLKGEKVY